MNRMSWDDYGLELASTAAKRSEDPYLKVGACILRSDRSVASLGYNGAASGVEISWNDRDARRGFVIHAEINALRYCLPNDTRDGYLYITHHPCAECIKVIASYGIEKIVFRDLIDNAVYNLESIQLLARICNITLEQKG